MSRSRLLRTSIFAVFTALALVFGMGSTANAAVPETEYIIQVRNDQVADLTRVLSTLRETPLTPYSLGTGVYLVSLASSELSVLEQSFPEMSVSLNQKLRLADLQPSAPWHLSALNRDANGSTPSNYRYPTSGGAGVDVYVIDSGVDISSWDSPGKQLYGRVTTGVGRNFVTTDVSSVWTATDNFDDCYNAQHDGGHGTHVAGIIASETYGVAKKANIIPLRVFSCPNVSLANGHYESSTDAATVIGAIQWAINRKLTTGHPSIINMSLGGASSAPLDSAVNAAISNGITVISAAGNSSTDACSNSPARVPLGITVGAVDSSNNFSSYSNRGSCVSILAPGGSSNSGGGVNSLAAWNPSGFTNMAGTSMATPAVSGVAALYLAKVPNASPASVKNAIQANATIASNVPDYTTTKLLNSLWIQDATSVTQPASLSVSKLTATSVTLSWASSSATSSFGPTAITDYQVRYKLNGSESWSAYQHSALGANNTITVTGLTSNTQYVFEVAGMSGDLVGSYSTSSSVKTPTGLTSAVRNIKNTARTAGSVSMAWSAPTTLRGGVITDYYIYYRKAGSKSWIRFKDKVTTAKTVKVTGLRSWTNYNFKVQAKTAQGLGSVKYLNVRTR